MPTPTTIPATLRELADRLEAAAEPNALDRAWRLARALDPRATITLSGPVTVWAEARSVDGRLAQASATSASVAVAQLAEELEECVALRLTELRAQARAEHDAAERAAIETEARDLEVRAA